VKIPDADNYTPKLHNDVNEYLLSTDSGDDFDEEELESLLLDTLTPEHLYEIDVQNEKGIDCHTNNIEENTADDIDEYNAYLESLCYY